jgi:hypothetical protein
LTLGKKTNLFGAKNGEILNTFWATIAVLFEKQ